MARIIFFIFAVMCCITTGSKASQSLPEEKSTLTGAYLYEVPGSSQMKDMQKAALRNRIQKGHGRIVNGDEAYFPG